MHNSVARLHLITALLLCLSFSSSAQVSAKAETAVVALRAAKMLDTKAGKVVANPVVIIEGDRIRQIGPGLTIPAGAKIIDLGSATIMPGLIDAHTHLLQNYDFALGGDDSNMILTITQMSTAERALLGAKMGREDLEAGITTVRDVGNSGINGDVALRDAINKGWVSGPRMVACTRALAAAGGQLGHLQHDAQDLIAQEYVVIATVDDARRAVQQAFYDGADCIKVIVNTGPRVVSQEEMKAIVEEAHRVHKKVAAHAIGDDATRIAANAGGFHRTRLCYPRRCPADDGGAEDIPGSHRLILPSSIFSFFQPTRSPRRARPQRRRCKRDSTRSARACAKRLNWACR